VYVDITSPIDKLSYCRFQLLIHLLQRSVKAGSQGFCLLIVRDNESFHVRKDGADGGTPSRRKGVVESTYFIGD
jgi:hypothetical protein